MRNNIFILICLFLASCNISKNERKSDFLLIDLSGSIVQDSMESFFDFYEKYPIALKKVDSLIYIIQIKAKDCIIVLDMNTKQIIDSLGNVGHGPNDLIGPNFILTVNNPEVLIEDGNLKKMMKIESSSDSTRLVEYIEYPDPIFLGSEINLSPNFIVGRKVNAEEGKMFFIYNRDKDSISEIDCLPKLNKPISDVNYTYAPTIAFNEQKNSIIVGMYFFDMFHIYDLTGKHIKTCCFSENPIPHINSKTQKIDLGSDYSGIIRTFSTDDYCYLLRYSQKKGTDHSEYTIVQLNWEGELINSYIFKDDISGQFYVDEKMKKIYLIKRSINSQGEEIFSIGTYKL